jgi:MYXO-CTERM domain-containing protein
MWWIGGSSGCLGIIPMVGLTALAMVTGAGCADAGSDHDDRVETTVTTGSAPSIYGGIEENEKAPSTVALKVGHGGKFELCSGALVAPNVLITARHCVGNSLTTTVSCDENGQSTNGPHVDGNLDPAAISVYVGTSPNFESTPTALGQQIVSPSTDHFCNTDIALVVLDRPIPNAAPLAVRLEGTVAPGESIRSIGYGQNDRLAPMGTRFSKADVAVLAMGRGVSTSNTALGSHEFEVGRSICQGDSGGPAISEKTGAIVGVVSRGSDCQVDFGHIYTTTAGWSDLFTQAFAVAGGAPNVETGGPVGPAAGNGTTEAEPHAPPPSSQAGCSTSGAGMAKHDGTSSFALFGLAGMAALLLRARRERRRS